MVHTLIEVLKNYLPAVKFVDDNVLNNSLPAVGMQCFAQARQMHCKQSTAVTHVLAVSCVFASCCVLTVHPVAYRKQ
jgi:hypothetical protein